MLQSIGSHADSKARHNFKRCDTTKTRALIRSRVLQHPTSVYLGFTRDMRRMFNGAPVVTHGLAQFVEELDRGTFSGKPIGHRNAREC